MRLSLLEIRAFLLPKFRSFFLGSVIELGFNIPYKIIEWPLSPTHYGACEIYNGFVIRVEGDCLPANLLKESAP